MISLFEHNERAYRSAVEMLSETKRAAVIHPTGTGKSFIGFRLAEDNPDKVICWLSPSEYIFKTQLENLKRSSGGFSPENILFFTYAKLIVMSDEEIQSINPDFIVLDEFHRCGAEVWGDSVRKLLSFFKDVPVLGLSATNVRYLDNQTELEKYRKKIRSARFAPVRDKAERCLEELRRTLENSEGLDIIFDKNMTERSGKYIVFCANAEHMDEMISHVPEWFGRVDRDPEIYKVYSESSESGQEFERFRNSKSNRLKLLFCIDMLIVGELRNCLELFNDLNEILTASWDEMYSHARSYYLEHGNLEVNKSYKTENGLSLGSWIVTQRRVRRGDSYVLLDERRIRLLDEIGMRWDYVTDLNWEKNFRAAKAFYEKNGELCPHSQYVDENGVSLGSWLSNLRTYRKSGIHKSYLTEERIDQLDRMGMVWTKPDSWEVRYSLVKKYYDEFGNLDIPSGYVSDGIWISKWLDEQRQIYRGKRKGKSLTNEQVKKLECLGFRWHSKRELKQKSQSIQANI